MSRKLRVFLPLMLALIMLVALAAPAFAHVSPLGADNNALAVEIVRPGLTYHLGDVIEYTVNVYVPLTTASGTPGYQTKIDVSFDQKEEVPNVTADDTFLFRIPSLLPGESYVFSSAGYVYSEYVQGVGQPTRAELTSGTAAMPVGATFASHAIAGGPYPILDYTIVQGDLVLVGGQWQITALARVVNKDNADPLSPDFNGGAHVTTGELNDSNDKETTITTTVSIPETVTTITSSAFVVDLGQSVTLTVTEQNTGSVPLTSPHVVLLKNGAAFADLTKTLPAGSFVGGDTDGDGVLDGSATIPETWTWSIDSGPLTVNPTVFQADGHGMDNSVPPVDITFTNGYTTERDLVTISVNTPGTTVGVSSSVNPPVLPIGGGLVTLTFTEANTGTVPLDNAAVTVLKDGNPFIVLSAPPTSGDAAPLGTLDVGETWSWTVPVGFVAATTTFQATGDATYGNPPIHVTWPDYPSERTSITITVPPPQQVPASTNLGIGIMIAALAGVMALFIYRRTRRSQIG